MSGYQVEAKAEVTGAKWEGSVLGGRPAVVARVAGLGRGLARLVPIRTGRRLVRQFQLATVVGESALDFGYHGF